jgi:lysozyme
LCTNKEIFVDDQNNGGDMYKINQEGLDLIKRFEGLRLNSYQCTAGKWTIGYGHTNAVHPNETITEEEAEDLLKQDIRNSEDTVNRSVKMEINSNQFSALVSFVFNIGSQAFRSSTMLRKINEGHMDRAANEFMRWVYVDSEISNGLVKRRKAEQLLFNKKEV